MDVGEPVGDVGRHHPRHDARPGLEHGDVDAEAAGGGGDLEADDAGADDGEAPGSGEGAQIGGEGEGIVETAQDAQARIVAAGNGETARRAAGGDHRHVEVDRGSVREPRPAGVPIKAGDAETQAGVDAQRRPFGGRHHREILDRTLPEQQFLAQRRSLVGRVDLLADHDDRPAMAGRAQALSHTRAGLTGPRDEHRQIETIGRRLEHETPFGQ